MNEEIKDLIKKIKSKNKKATRFMMDLSKASGVKYDRIWRIINEDLPMKEKEFFMIRSVIDDIKPMSKGCVIRTISEEDLKFIVDARDEGMSYQKIANSLPSGKKVSMTFVFNLLSKPGSQKNRLGHIKY